MSDEQLCPSCAESCPVGANWCEACGHDLNEVVLGVCVSCGDQEVDDSMYCGSCGHKQPSERDHVEVDEGTVVAVSDRGRRHRHNEDAVAVLGGVRSPQDDQRPAVLVVCDGVSSTSGSAEVSVLTAEATRDAIASSLTGAVASPVDEAIRKAVAGAQEIAASCATSTEAIDSDPAKQDGAPSTTLVTVVAEPGKADSGSATLTVGWVGDSRAYWIGEDEARKLNGDDHEIDGSLTRWLGADSHDPTPEVVTVEVEGRGLVVACSDGLWRYAAEPDQMAAQVRGLTDEHGTGMKLAKALVDFANGSGGHDNISVALWSNIENETNQPEVGEA